MIFDSIMSKSITSATNDEITDWFRMIEVEFTEFGEEYYWGIEAPEELICLDPLDVIEEYHKRFD